MNEPLLKRSAVAELLSVHPKTLRRWELSGQLSAVQIGPKTTRYERDEVERLLQKQRTRTHSKPGPKRTGRTKTPSEASAAS